MAVVNINILGISEWKWIGRGELATTVNKNVRRSGVALIVNKKVQNAVLGCNLKNDRMISVHFQCKQFNITIIQVFSPTTNTEEAEVDWFYENL